MYMATSSSLIQSFSGIKSLSNVAGYAKMPLQFPKSDAIRFNESHHGTALALRRTQILEKLSFHGRSATVPISHAGRNELSYNDDYHTVPFWLSTIQAGIGATRSLFLFLAEQPSQLRYIESPSFQSTASTFNVSIDTLDRSP